MKNHVFLCFVNAIHAFKVHAKYLNMFKFGSGRSGDGRQRVEAGRRECFRSVRSIAS